MVSRASRLLSLVGVALLVLVSRSAAGGEPVGRATPAPTKPAERERVEALIQQLGGPRFAERRAAEQTLAAIGLPALQGLRAAAHGDRGLDVSRRAQRLLEEIENRLDCLVTLYRQYGLPFPPEQAPLVRYPAAASRDWSFPDDPRRTCYALGFLLRPATGAGPVRIQRGTRKFEPAADKPLSRLNAGELTGPGVAALTADLVEESYGDLAMAVHCKVRGWDALAEALLAHARRSVGSDRVYRFPAFFQEPRGDERKGDRTLWALFHELAWDYWRGQVTEPDTNWAACAQRLTALLAADPRLATAESRLWLEDLKASLGPSRAPPGSVAAAIDRLRDVRSIRFDTKAGYHDPAYADVAGLGFNAVPELIAHLDDKRLTRTEDMDFHYRPPVWQRRVGQLADELLATLALRGFATKAEAQQWWVEAKLTGEEAYLAKQVFPADLAAETPNARLLWLLARKYPRRLSGVYRTLLDERPLLESASVAAALAQSHLPAEAKRDLYVYAASHTNAAKNGIWARKLGIQAPFLWRSLELRHRHTALGHLAAVDPGQFVKHLVATLADLPASSDGLYAYCQEVSFAQLVRETDAAPAWEALLGAARRADVGLRLEYLKAVGDCPARPDQPGPRQLRRRLRWLALFLDDATPREVASNSAKFNGAIAGEAFPSLEVRNFAALELAGLMQLPVRLPRGRLAKPFEDWTTDQWTKLRAAVREAVRQRVGAGPVR
jgi:hypothetical protein